MNIDSIEDEIHRLLFRRSLASYRSSPTLVVSSEEMASVMEVMKLNLRIVNNMDFGVGGEEE
jgi:hypothetical protein